MVINCGGNLETVVGGEGGYVAFLSTETFEFDLFEL